MTTATKQRRIERTARLTWVPISLMHVSEIAQRELKQSRVDHLVANFDPEQIGVPTLNKREDGRFFVIDGQHRVETMRVVGWGDQQLQCNLYEGLTEEEEAEMFMKLNDTLAVDARTKFRISVNAGRTREVAINNVVEGLGCHVTVQQIEGAISCTGTLTKVFDRAGVAVLGKTIRILRDSFGDSGYGAAMIDGLSLVCDRYGEGIDEEWLIQKLSTVHAGVHGVLGKAEQLRRTTGLAKGQAVAHTIVDLYNVGRGRGNKIPAWLRES